MQLEITDEASRWFRQELALPQSGAGIRFFGKAYGKTQVHNGFSIGMTRDDTPIEPEVLVRKDGVQYFIEASDDWFFENLRLTVDYDAALDEPKYLFVDETAL